MSSLIRMILFLKSIWAQASAQAKPLISNMADNIREQLLKQGKITDKENDPVVGRNTSLEEGMKNLNLMPKDITPEQKTLQDLQGFGIDVTPLKSIMPELFTVQPVTQPITQKGVQVPTYGTVNIPPGTVPIRDYLKNIYGIGEDNLLWSNEKGLTVKTPKGDIFLGKPVTPEAGKLVGGTWYTTPSFVDTALASQGAERQKTPIREALPAYLESLGIKGAVVDWNKGTNQAILKIGDKSYSLGKPSDIGTLINGTTFVTNEDILKMLKPYNTDLGIKIETPEVSEETPEEDLTEKTGAELNLAMEENAGKIMNTSYDDLIAGITKDMDENNTEGFLYKMNQTYKDLIATSLASIDAALQKATAAMAATKGAYDEQAQIAYGEIDKSVQVAKGKSAEEMSARGIYFSGLTTRAMIGLEAQGISEKNKVRIEVLKYKAQIDAQIAILTANTEMSKSQLTNELNAKAALDKLAYIEKQQDKLDAIKTLQVNLNNTIEIDKINLPIANELEKRQVALDNQKASMDFFKNFFMPYLQLQYQDKWKNESADQKFLDLQQAITAFFANNEIDWAKLGLATQKQRNDTAIAWAKLGLEEFKASKAATPKTELPSWLKQYTPFITMRVDQLDSILSGKSGFSFSNGSIVQGGGDTLTDENRTAIMAIRDFVSATMPGKEGKLFAAWDSMQAAFGSDAAIALIDQIDVGENPNIQLVLFRQVLEDYNNPKDFAKFIKTNPVEKTKAYLNSLEKMLEGFGYNYNDASTIISNFITNLLYGYGG